MCTKKIWEIKRWRLGYQIFSGLVLNTKILNENLIMD